VSAEPLILASGSPRRRELLGSLGVRFEVIIAEVEEDNESTSDPKSLVRLNARSKAGWVADRYPRRYVLGADTTVFLDGRILNKPRDLDESRSMLVRLSGRTHSVYTGLVLINRDLGREEIEVVASEVTFLELDEEVIEAYLESVNTLDKAGGYAIQEYGEKIVAGHSGSLSNIIGLPLDETKAILTRHSLLVDDFEESRCQ
jgi:septum formation protein